MQNFCYILGATSLGHLKLNVRELSQHTSVKKEGAVNISISIFLEPTTLKYFKHIFF